MKLLVITGDTRFKPGHPRYELQRSAVDVLEVIYWGKGSYFPRLSSGEFDVVSTQDPFWRGLYGMYAAHKKRVRLNVQVHTDLSVQSLFRHIVAQIVLRHADSIRVVSEKLRAQVERVGARAKISVLPIYIDTPTFNSILRREHSEKRILWIGRFEEEKNPLLAVDILREVLKKIPDAHLTMLGRGSYGKRISDHIGSLPVEIPGWQNPVLFFETADVVLCTSFHESYGAGIVEALAAGVPVVAPDVGVAREAGANVVEREKLAEEVIKVLNTGARGELKIKLFSRDEWVTAWKRSLL